MTVDQFAEQVASQNGEVYTDPDTADLFRQWVQEVSDDLWQAAPWYFRNRISQKTISAGVRTLEILADSVITSIAITGTTNPDTSSVGKPIVYKPFERMLSRPNTNVYADTGTPVVWWFETEGADSTFVKLAFYKVPDYDYNIDVHQLLAAPVLAAATVLPYPQDFFPALTAGMRAKLKMNDGDVQAAQMFEQQFGTYASRLGQTYSGPMGQPSKLASNQRKAVNQNPIAQGAGT